MKTLYLGGARSGKSRLAEQRAINTGKQRIYLATGEALDEEMGLRIQHHKSARDDRWLTIEEPTFIANAIQKYDNKSAVILVDCLTLWLSNCLHAGVLSAQKTLLFEALNHLQGDIIFVSNEVGSGIVPLGKLNREFADHAGWLNQSIAERCDNVYLVSAGLPITLKNTS